MKYWATYNLPLAYKLKMTSSSAQRLQLLETDTSHCSSINSGNTHLHSKKDATLPFSQS